MIGATSAAARVTVFVLVAVLVGVAAISALLLVRDSDSGPAKMPNLVGKDYESATAALDTAGISADREYRAIANATVPADRLAAQRPAAGQPVPAPGTEIVLEFSAGGPTITFAELPARARAFANTLMDYDETELILVTTTAKGVAFKTDAWLFGPCPAVDAAYRTYPDPTYGDKCY